MSKAEIAAERKDQIVRATVDCIAKYGYHNFSMQDVAKHAGVSKGIIHYYFLNKDELMMSVLQRVSRDIEQVLASDMDAIQSASKKLEVFIRVCCDVIRSTKEYYQVSMDFWTQINQKDQVREVISSHYAKFRQTCASVLEEGIKANEFRVVDTKEYASYVIAVIDGLSLQFLFDESAFNFDRLVTLSKQLILDGLQPALH